MTFSVIPSAPVKQYAYISPARNTRREKMESIQVAEVAATIKEVAEGVALLNEAKGRLERAISDFESLLDRLNVPIDIEYREPFYIKEVGEGRVALTLAFKCGQIYVVEREDGDYISRISLRQLKTDEILTLLRSGALVKFLDFTAEWLRAEAKKAGEAAEILELITQAIRPIAGQ